MQGVVLGQHSWGSILPDGDPAGGGTVAHKNRYLETVHQLRGRPWSSPSAETAEVPSPRQSRGAATKPAGASLDLQHANDTSCVGVGIRGWWMRCWIPPSAECWSVISTAYNHYPGLKQRCWAHLLRDIHDLPRSAGLAQWAEAVHQVYTEAKASVLPRAQPGHRTQLMLEEKLMVLARPFLKDPLAVQAKLCRRMERYQGTVCLRVGPSRALRQQRRRAEPAASGNQSQDQRRHPLRAGHRQQDDLGIPLWHLAG